MPEYNYSKMKGKIKELGLTQSDFAKKIGITEQTLSLRFSNKRPFRQDEIMKIMSLFSEPLENIHIYFFDKKVQKNRTCN
jgi:DNA-binding XRE family transcriptional regulator